MFPAEALARDCSARGSRVALVTDRRGQAFGDRCRAWRCIASAPAGSAAASSARSTAVAEIALGIVEARRLLRALAPAAVVGFGGYPSVPTMLAATRQRLADPDPRAERGARPRQPPAGAARRRIATAFAAWRAAAGRPRPRGRDRQSGAPGDRGAARTPYAAARATARSSSWSRRQPGRADLQRDRAGGAGALLAGAARAGCASGSRRGPRISPRCARRIAAAGIAAEVATFFDDVPERLARAQLVICRAGASTVAELAVDRPAGDPGALSATRPTITRPPMPRACNRRAPPGWWREARVHAASCSPSARDAAGRSPAALRRRRGRGARLGRPDAARAACRSRRAGAGGRHGDGRRGSTRHESAAARHRHDPFRRHRRHRHERHRRDPAQSRLPGAGQRRRRQRQCAAGCARSASRSRSAIAPRISATAQVVVVSSAVKPDNPEVVAARARRCRWCAAPRCWAS